MVFQPIYHLISEHTFLDAKDLEKCVQVTLIQLAQLTGDPDEIGSGRGPKRLKPLFQKAVAAASTSQPNNSKQASVTQPQPTATAVVTPSAHAQTAQNSIIPSAQPTRTAIRKPLSSFSIRAASENRATTAQPSTRKEDANVASAIERQPIMEDLPIAEDGVRICWKQFAGALPKEASATAGRLLNIIPRLKPGPTIEVYVENDMVATDMHNIMPQMEAYLRQQLQNSKISIKVMVDASLSISTPIYGRLEQYQMMEKRNPALKRLKELLNLDLE